MQNDTVHILSTRMVQQDLVQRSKENGINIDAIPFIKIVPETGKALQKRIDQLTKESLLAIFTSANAVKHLAALLKDKTDWQIVCLSGATYNAAMAVFGEKAIICTAKDAASLAEKIQDLPSGKKVFFCGNRRLDHLPAYLNKNGIALEEVVLYNTIDTPQKTGKDYKAILFFSPSAVESYYSINEPSAETVLFAIGATTAAAISKYSTNKIITSPGHRPEDLIEQIITYYKNEK